MDITTYALLNKKITSMSNQSGIITHEATAETKVPVICDGKTETKNIYFNTEMTVEEVNDFIFNVYKNDIDLKSSDFIEFYNCYYANDDQTILYVIQTALIPAERKSIIGILTFAKDIDEKTLLKQTLPTLTEEELKDINTMDTGFVIFNNMSTEFNHIGWHPALIRNSSKLEVNLTFLDIEKESVGEVKNYNDQLADLMYSAKYMAKDTLKDSKTNKTIYPTTKMNSIVDDNNNIAPLIKLGNGVIKQQPIIVDGQTIIETINLDTTKSAEQVTAILNSISDYVEDMYIIAANIDKQVLLALAITEDNTKLLLAEGNIGSMLPNISPSEAELGAYVLFSTSADEALGFTSAGWNPALKQNNSQIIFNAISDLVFSVMGPQIKVGSQNDRLKDIMYINCESATLETLSGTKIKLANLIDTSNVNLGNAYIMKLGIDLDTGEVGELEHIDWNRVSELINQHRYNDLYISLASLDILGLGQYLYSLDTLVIDGTETITNAVFSRVNVKVDHWFNGIPITEGLQVSYINLNLKANTWKLINDSKNMGTLVVANPVIDEQDQWMTENIQEITIGSTNYRLPTQTSYPADQIPAAPTAAGTYTLECTVSAGSTNPVYTWIKK